MLYSSRDLLYIVLAFCVLWLTIFVSWILYYVARLLRDAYRSFKDLRDRLNLIDQFIRTVTEKLEHTTSYLGLMVEAAGRMVAFLQDRQEEKRKRKRSG